MRKFTLFLALLCCVTTVMADWHVHTYEEWPFDNIYLTDFAFNPITGDISFTDNFKVGTELDREYYFYVHEQYPSSKFYSAHYTGTINSNKYLSEKYTRENYNYGRKTGGDNGWWSDCLYSTSFMIGMLYTTSENAYCAPVLKVKNSKGGRITGRISHNNWLILRRMYESSCRNFRICVKPMVSGGIGRPTSYDEIAWYTVEGSTDYNTWLGNCFDVTRSAARVTDTLWTPIEEVKDEILVHYDEPLVLPVIVQTGNELNATWQYRHSDKDKWLNTRPVEIKASEAKKGYRLTWNYGLAFQKNTNTLDIRLRLAVKKKDSKKDYDTIYVDMPTVTIVYPLHMLFNGVESRCDWYKVNEQHAFSHTDCREADITSDGTPFRRIMSNENDLIEYIFQPAAPLYCDVTTPTYTVRFFDYDGKLLKTEPVVCGNAATAPAAPTHTGYTFEGWDKTFGNVHKDMDVRARYNGFSTFGTFELIQTKHESNFKQLENSLSSIAYDDWLTFSVNIKASSLVQVWMQRSLDGGNTWITNGGITTISAAEASAAGGYTFETKFHLQDDIQQKSVGFRLCLKCNDTEVYTNANFYDMYYPIITVPNSDFDEMLMVSNSAESHLISVEAGRDTLLTMCGDTVWMRDMLGNDNALTINDTHLQTEQHSETGYNYLVCDRKNTIEYSVLTHTVWYEVLGINSKAEYGLNNIFAKETVIHGKPAMMDRIPTDPFDDEGKEFFAYWTDENTGEQAKLTAVTDDMWLMAEFTDHAIPDTFTVTYLDNDKTVLGTERVADGDAARGNLYLPSPIEGARFEHWDQDLTCISEDITTNPIYGKIYDSYNVWLMRNDVTMGEVTGDGEYEKHTIVTVKAVPKTGYIFVRWLEISDANPEGEGVSSKSEYTFSLMNDITLKAVFAKGTGFETTEVSGDSANRKSIENGQLIIIREGKKFNAMGVQIR